MESGKLDSVINLTRRLIKINSENPVTTELQVQECICEYLSNLGFQIELVKYDTDRNNVIAIFPPLTQADSFGYEYFAFSGHMDTVPGYVQSRSNDAPVEDGKLYGRGACDMKGGIASFLVAINVFLQKYKFHLKKGIIKRGICVILSVDEENGDRGHIQKTTFVEASPRT